MEEFDDQACPLCGAMAKYRFADYKNRKRYWCPTCVEFQISMRAESRLSTLIRGWRARYSQQAKKANSKRVLVITIPRLAEEGGLFESGFHSASSLTVRSCVSDLPALLRPHRTISNGLS